MNFRKKGGRNDEFSEKGGVTPIQKISLQILSVILSGKNDEFSEKEGGHSNPKIFVADFSTPEKSAT